MMENDTSKEIMRNVQILFNKNENAIQAAENVTSESQSCKKFFISTFSLA